MARIWRAHGTVISVVKGSIRTRRRAVRLMAAASGGYLLGVIPSADIAARITRRSDLRMSGTGNPGGMNASHVLGKSWGMAVSVVDIAKGVAAARLGQALAGDAGANLASTAAVGGHCFPLGRTGGKGVATSIGQVIGTFPVYLPLDAAVALATSVMPLKQRTRTATTVASITWVADSGALVVARLAQPGRGYADRFTTASGSSQLGHHRIAVRRRGRNG